MNIQIKNVNLLQFDFVFVGHLLMYNAYKSIIKLFYLLLSEYYIFCSFILFPDLKHVTHDILSKNCRSLVQQSFP